MWQCEKTGYAESWTDKKIHPVPSRRRQIPSSLRHQISFLRFVSSFWRTYPSLLQCFRGFLRTTTAALRVFSRYTVKIQMYYYFCTYSTYPYLHSAECPGLCNSLNRYQGRKNRENRAHTAVAFSWIKITFTSCGGGGSLLQVSQVVQGAATD